MSDALPTEGRGHFGCLLVIYVSTMNHILVFAMGIVKISEQMHENLRLTSGALSRSINAQAEHWLRVGMLSELNPNLRYGEICQLLIQAEHQAAGEMALPAALAARAA